MEEVACLGYGAIPETPKAVKRGSRGRMEVPGRVDENPGIYCQRGKRSHRINMAGRGIKRDVTHRLTIGRQCYSCQSGLETEQVSRKKGEALQGRKFPALKRFGLE